MCCKRFTTRILTFFLTFAVGLFIASFFVSIAVPSFQIPNRGWRRDHREYDRQREEENKQLRERNADLERQLTERDSDAVDYQNLKYVPPAPPSLKNVPRSDR